ncbi:MAG: hypothetical protein JWO22_3099 [Frankiales bacterium]|nr:hypothetical protein [Frankiales bacterium]
MVVRGAGFPASQQLAVQECLAHPGRPLDVQTCDLVHLRLLASDSDGKVSVPFVLRVGPFGGDKVHCRVASPCVVLVRQQIAGSTVAAEAPVAFSE